MGSPSGDSSSVIVAEYSFPLGDEFGVEILFDEPDALLIEFG